MKSAFRISKILKVIGIVLVLCSIVLGLYVLINSVGLWNQMKTQGLDVYGVTTDITDKARFDDSVFSALSDASSTRSLTAEERSNRIRPFFSRWFNQLEKAEAGLQEATVAETAAWLDTDFDAKSFIERLAAMEGLQDTKELRQIFDYVNSFSAAPKKGKLAGLQAASLEPWFTDYFATYSAEHEDAGTWVEFMATVRAMLEADVAAGNSVKDVKAWMSSSFSDERYYQTLEEVRLRERTDDEETFADALEAQILRKQSGETVSWSAFIAETAAKLESMYPDRNLKGSVTTTVALAEQLPAILGNESFDGSYGAIAETLQKAAQSDSRKNVRSWEDGYLTSVLQEADNRTSVGVITYFWAAAAKYLQILFCGILLLILSRIIKIVVNKIVLKSREASRKAEDDDVLLRVDHLKQYFKSGDSVTKAVDDISFFIKKGEVFGLVGESGCGKTTTGRTIINLYDPTEGDVYFDGLRISSTLNGLPVLKAQIRQDYQAKIKQASDPGEARRLKAEMKQKLHEAEDRALESSVEKSKATEFYREKRLEELKTEYEADIKNLSGAAAEERTRRYETERKVAAKDNVMTRMQMIFQDPIASINPRMTVREIIAEGLIIRGVKDKEYINKKVDEMLELVGLVREHADRYPHEFSGGQRQRIGIARAIIMEPDLIIADEPISALDVSIQAQVINLLNDLRERMGLTIMFIAHNLSVVKYFSDRIAVMYFGHIVEMATSDELFAHPLHPYTKSLLSAIPYPDPHYEKNRKRIVYNPAESHDYSKEGPTLREITPGHFILCNEEEYQKYLKEIR